MVRGCLPAALHFRGSKKQIMNTVPVLSMIFMGISCLVSIAVPVILFIYYWKKGADRLPFFIGCFIFVFFALVLESLVHQAVLLRSSAGQTIQNNIWLYALYGGAMAALFEECGRAFAFRFLLRKHSGNDRNALMYGAGHGGIEAVIVLGGTMINNLIYSSMINQGTINDMLVTLDPAQQQQLLPTISALIASPSYIFLFGIIERILAIALHISLSVFVFYAVREKRLPLFFLALLFHFVMDAAAVLLSSVLPALLVEVFIALCVASAVLIARKIYNEYSAGHAAAGE